MILHCQHPFSWVKTHFLSAGYAIYLKRYSLIMGTYSGEYGYGSDGESLGPITPTMTRANVDALLLAFERKQCEIGISPQVFDMVSRLPNYILTLDFIGKPDLKTIREGADHVYGDEPYALYDSGNSYHAYGSRPHIRSVYLARLALALSVPIIDQSWLRLSTGSQGGVLRWTHFNKPMILRVGD